MQAVSAPRDDVAGRGEPGYHDEPTNLRDGGSDLVRDLGHADPGLGGRVPAAVAAPMYDHEELQAATERKRVLLDDAARATSFHRGGARHNRAAQMRMLEMELSRAAAHRDLLRKVALSAEASQRSEEERAVELEARREEVESALADIEAWMDRQPLSRKAQPPDKQQELAKLVTQAQVAREAAIAQRMAAKREGQVYLHAKHEADRADREYHASAEIRESLALEKVEQEALQRSEVAVKVSTEAAVAAKMEVHHRARAAQRGEARRDLHEKAKVQLKAAQAARGAAAERTNLLVRDAAPALEKVVRMREEAHAQRVECVLQLKADTEAAAALIRGRNEKKAREKLSEEAQHEAEKEELAAKGLNPYKVFKQRAVDARSAKEGKRQESRIHRRKEDLATRLRNEEILQAKHDAKARSDREYEQRFRNELGKHVTDARNREYLRARTVDGTDNLDPSGRSFRVEPSQVTTIKDAAFGLGRHPRKPPAMAAAVVDLVASKPRHAGVGTGEFERLVPVVPEAEGGILPTTAEQTDEAGGDKFASYDGAAGLNREFASQAAAAKQGGRSSAAASQQQLLEDLVPPMGTKTLPGTGIPFVEDSLDGERVKEGVKVGGGGGDARGPGRGRTMSLFERQALQKARTRQQERMETGKPQVAAGWVFKDRPSFVAKPERVVFKDFVVGKVHRRRVVLTNASLTFNTLKVLELSDEISRFFEVTYSKPGRLSAGMTCTVDIAFTPKVEEDIFTELSIRTQTGPLAIPVECTARRVKPKLSTNLVAFRGTIMGEKETARVIVTNDGAIPTRFTVANGITNPAAGGNASVGIPAPTTSPVVRTTTDATAITGAHNTTQPGEEVIEATPSPNNEDGARMLLDNRDREGDTQSDARESARGPPTEDQLLQKACAFGDAGTQQSEGKRELEVAGGGEIAGYSSSEIVVTFSPLSVGAFRTAKVIEFEGSREKFELVVEASSSPVAVYPAEACTDLRCCVFGKLYVKKLRICNRGKIAMKAIARVPPSLRGCVSFNPDMGFVQPGSFFEFGLRFRPDEECLARCARDGWGRVTARSTTTSRISSESEHEVGKQRPDTTQHNDSTERCPTSEADGIKEEDKADMTVEAGMIAIPLLVEVPGQALPARPVLQAKVTCWKVEVICGGGDGGNVVNFGACFVGQSVTRRVLLRNTSLLPLKYGFIGNPPEVELQPADGFGVLLPGEERWVEATFSPFSAVVHDSSVALRTSLGQKTTIRCRGCGVEPVVSLSHTVISLAPACAGDTVTASVFVNNVSSVEQWLEFLAPEPEHSFLKICPSIAHLQPGRGMRVEVSFCPAKVPNHRHDAYPNAPVVEREQHAQEGDAEVQQGTVFVPTLAPSAGAEGAVETAGESKNQSKRGGGAGGRLDEAAASLSGGGGGGYPLVVPIYAGALEEGGGRVPGGARFRPPSTTYLDGTEWERGDVGDIGENEGDETWSRHGRWRVPCFLKSEGHKGSEALPPLALEVNTVTVARVLSVDKTRLEFGQLAVGSKAEAILRVRNAGQDEAPLEGGGLNAAGPFQAINAFRPVPARGGSHRCLLQFRPERAGIVTETLVLTSPALGKTIRVRLRGEGVTPLLTIEPADGNLDMGHVLEGDTVEREVEIRNDSVFPMRYTSKSFGSRPPSNINSIETFALTPCERDVPPGESVAVKAVFSPDYGRVWPFLGAFKIEAKDQPDGGHVLRIRGRCLSRQVYVEAAPPGKSPGDQMAEAAEDVLAQRTAAGEGGVGGSPLPQPPQPQGLPSVAPAPPPILLRFPKDREDLADAGGEAQGGVAKESIPPAGAAVMRVVVGCLTTNDPKKSSAGNFEVELSTEAKEKGYFRMTPDKGSVAPGATAEITCAFEPPAPPPRMPGPAGGKGGALEIGQWYKTTALVHVRGGYRPPGASEVFTVPVQLEGFVTA